MHHFMCSHSMLKTVNHHNSNSERNRSGNNNNNSGMSTSSSNCSDMRNQENAETIITISSCKDDCDVESKHVEF